MKRFLILLLCAVFILNVFGCGGRTDEPGETAVPEKTQEASATDAAVSPVPLVENAPHDGPLPVVGAAGDRRGANVHLRQDHPRIQGCLLPFAQMQADAL